MTATKAKVSLTISADLIAMIDREAGRVGTTRSAMAERYLRSGASRAAERSIEELTAAYYASIRGPELDEQEAIARASSRAAKKLSYDAPVRRASRAHGSRR